MRVSRVIGTVVWLNSSKYASWCKESLQQTRLMTTSKWVQDRSRKKRVQDLEVVMEKWKIASKEAEDLVAEEEGLLEQHADKAAEHVTRFLMMLIDKQLPVFGIVSWNPAWAVTELYKKANGRMEKQSYLCPYADAQSLEAGSQEFDKRAVAAMHELLSFTIEKRLITDHLTHFCWEFVMPQKLMRFLLKHFRFSVYLTEAYAGSDLIEKGPLVRWKEKHRIETFDDFLSDMEDTNVFEIDYENGNFNVELEQEETIDGLGNALLGDNV
ncbi:hypothetical protein PVL29_004069 [Vitis rotundifolia]|uniref:PORR domain-containing protein n=1 Tax=Vitis rotundifolia TaxID=103349 RepID=A0AA39A751_VITRO|nr:hypothetical protein PVL29_004069 [Vitis rotundifolia]